MAEAARKPATDTEIEALPEHQGKWLIAATFKEADPITAPPFEAHTFNLDLLWSIA